MDEEIKNEEIEEVKDDNTESEDIVPDSEDVVSDSTELADVADMIRNLEGKISGYFERISELLLKTGSVVEFDDDREYITEKEDVEYVPVEELDFKF